MNIINNLTTNGVLLKIVDDRITALQATVAQRRQWLRTQKRPDTTTTPRWHRELLAAQAEQLALAARRR